MSVKRLGQIDSFLFDDALGFSRHVWFPQGDWASAEAYAKLMGWELIGIHVETTPGPEWLYDTPRVLH